MNGLESISTRDQARVGDTDAQRCGIRGQSFGLLGSVAGQCGSLKLHSLDVRECIEDWVLAGVTAGRNELQERRHEACGRWPMFINR